MQVRNGEIGTDMHRGRNMKQQIRKGFFVGGAIVNAMEATGGRFPGAKWDNHRDSVQDLFLGGRSKTYPTPDGQLTFDKLSSVFISGNKTRDDQPDHIRIQHRVPRDLADLWANMCPAKVYTVGDEGSDGLVDVHTEPSNCVQCGAITAKGGRLTPPEGGSGPEYTHT